VGHALREWRQEAAVRTLSVHLAAALEARMMEDVRGLQLRVGDKALR
jgi:hypothetical protein